MLTTIRLVQKSMMQRAVRFRMKQQDNGVQHYRIYNTVGENTV